MSILFDAHEDPTNTASSEQQTKKARARNQQDERYPTQQSANKHDDILIFGYHCKLFRDDQIASDINNGKYLIPWMGNKELMIDRYDCRGHLYRIEEFDFESMGEFLPLSPEILDVENVCDEERYMDLNKDMSEENILQEEEDKRGSALYDPFTAYQNIEYSYEDSSDGKKLSDVSAPSSSNFDNQMYTQFCQYYGYDPKDENLKAYFQSQSQNQNSYQYDYERPPPPSEPPPVVSEPVSISAPPMISAPTYEKFKPPDGIEFPDGMEMPETRKMQQIIDKTAMFISKQSAQMEIVLKTKQSGNPQFAFLEFDNFLNPYYKFILGKIKSGEYEYIATKASDIEDDSTAKDEVDKEDAMQGNVENENDSDDGDDDDDGNENELHPLLQAHRRPLNNQAVPAVTSDVEVEGTVEVEEPIINHIPQTKMTGKVEDLAKVYMQWKYMPNPGEIPQDEMDEEKEDEENDESALKGVDELPPPPLPPPPSFILPEDDINTESSEIQVQADPAPSEQPYEMEHLGEQVDQQPQEMGQPQNLVPSVPHVPLGAPMFGGSMLPPLPPPPSLTTPSHFPQMRPPHFPLPQGFHGIPGHFLNTQFKHINQHTQYSHPPELYQVRSTVPPPPPPPLPSLLPPGVDAPPAPSTFTSTCTNTMGTIFDPGPPPLIPLSNHAIETESIHPMPIASISEPPLSDATEGLLPPGVETEEKPVVPPPPPPPLPPIGLFNMDPSEHNNSNDKSLLDGDNHHQLRQDAHNELEREDQERRSLEPSRNDNYSSPDDDNYKNHNNNDHSNNNNNNDRTLQHFPSREEERFTDSSQYIDSDKDRTFYRESKRRKRNSKNTERENSCITDTTTEQLPTHSLSNTYNTESDTCNQRTVSPHSSQCDQISEPLNSLRNSQPSASQSTSTSATNFPTKIITPGKDLQLVIDRLSLYVVKNGEEFEVGIKEKKDPRFDFLNPWNVYHPYYLNKKRVNLEAVQTKKRKEEERRKNLKVKFDLKTKVKPVSVATKKNAANTASVFNQNEDEEAADAPSEGFQPNIDPEVEIKRKLQKQIEEKEKLLKQLHEQAMLQQKITEVNKQASIKPMLQNLSPQQQAMLKKKVLEKQSSKDSALSAKQDERKKRAATFLGKLKKTSETEESNDSAGHFLRKRHFKETSASTSTQEATDRAAYEKKKDAFFKAINDAFKGGT